MDWGIPKLHFFGIKLSHCCVQCQKYDFNLAWFFFFCISLKNTYTQYMFLIFFGFAFLRLHHFFFLFILSNTGTESEVSFSLLNGSRNHNRHSGLDNSTTTTSTRILMSPGSKPVKIAAISGKPRVQRYLSRECEWFFNKPPTHAHKKFIFIFFCSIFNYVK